MNLFQLRAGAVTDAEYFHHSWINSAKELPLRSRLGRDILADYSRLAILPACSRPERFTVACSPTEPAFILGWAYVHQDTLGYVCVRQRYQRVGVASALSAAAGGKYYALPVDPRMLSLVKGREFRPLGAMG